jgi:hypothetical protein
MHEVFAPANEIGKLSRDTSQINSVKTSRYSKCAFAHQCRGPSRPFAGKGPFRQAMVAKQSRKENFKGWLLRGNID